MTGGSENWRTRFAVLVLLIRLNLNPNDPQTQRKLQIAEIQLANQDTATLPGSRAGDFLAATPGDLDDPLLDPGVAAGR